MTKLYTFGEMKQLLNANLELFALKFKNFKLDGNKTRFGFLLLCILLIVFLKFIAIPIIMLSYILISFFKKPSHA